MHPAFVTCGAMLNALDECVVEDSRNKTNCSDSRFIKKD